MNQQVKEKWVAALRSGKYEKGLFSLKVHRKETNTTCHCVLGVLCEIGVEAGLLKEKTGLLAGDIKFAFAPIVEKEPKNIMDYHYIPVELQNWAELHASTHKPSYGDIQIRYQGKVQSITYLNDVLKLNFNQLADAIEAYY